MKSELKIPDFQNEAEEAAWFAKNQDAMLERFRSAAKSGAMGTGTLARRGVTPTTTIRLDPADLERARMQAAERGLRYQTYLKMLIHQALTRESKRAPKKTRRDPAA